MKNIQLSLISLSLVSLILSSCRKENELIYSSTSFTAPISCIAGSGSNSDSIYYLGFDNGNIIRVNIIDNSQKLIKAGSNRVYDVYEMNDSTLYVGMRNEGVKRITYGKFKKRQSQYRIYDPLIPRKKTTAYSTYHIKADENRIYFATSTGLYTLSKFDLTNDSMLDQPPYYRPEKHKLYHFGINQTLIAGDKIFVATSDSGLILLNKDNPSHREKLINEEVISLFKDNDSIVSATTRSCIYRINLNETKKPIKIDSKKSDDILFAHLSTNNTEDWVISSSEIHYHSTKGNALFKFPDRLTESFKNIIYKEKNFIFVACHNTLYAFPLHQNPRGKANNIIAACHSDNGNCYFITLDYKLYFIERDKDQATLIEKLPHFTGENPIKLITGNHCLWLITNNSLFKIDLKNNKVSHEIGLTDSDAKLKIKENKVDFRSIHENNNTLYVGSRNYLFKITYSNDKIIADTLRTRDKTIDYSDLYITDISSENSDLYFASLKSGIFILKNGLLEKIAHTDTIGEIRRFLNASKEDTRVFTSKGIFTIAKNSITKTQSVQRSVLTLLDKSSGYFAIGYKGIIKTETKDEDIPQVDQFLDISINEAAITTDNGKDYFLYVGTQTGIYKFNGSLIPILIPDEEFPTWVITALLLSFFLITWIIFYISAKRIESRNRMLIKSLVDKTRDFVREGDQPTLLAKLKETENFFKENKKFQAIINVIFAVNRYFTLKKQNRYLLNLHNELEAKQVKNTDLISWFGPILSDHIQRLNHKALNSDNSNEALIRSNQASDLENLKTPPTNLQEIKNEIVHLVKNRELLYDQINQIKDEHSDLLRAFEQKQQEVSNLSKTNSQLTDKLELLNQEIINKCNEYQLLVSDYNRQESQLQETLSKVVHFIKSVINELNKYQSLFTDGERERLMAISQQNISIETLSKLNDSITNLLNTLSQFLYIDDLPTEMRAELKKIFDKNEHRAYINEIRLKSRDIEKLNEEKEGFNFIKEQSELFFQSHRALLGVFDNWSGTKKSVACLYLLLSKPLAQDVVTNLYDRVTGKTASDIRAEIHADLNEVTHKNYLLDKLWNKTRSTRSAKNGNKPEKEDETV